MRKWRKHDRVGRNDKNNKRRQVMSENTVLGGKPFEDLRSVADAALKIMTGQPQEVKEEEEEKEVTKEDQPQKLTE
mgnify:CR=1 FL=1